MGWSDMGLPSYRTCVVHWNAKSILQLWFSYWLFFALLCALPERNHLLLTVNCTGKKLWFGWALSRVSVKNNQDKKSELYAAYQKVLNDL
jgi:hypothetical protein